MAGDLKRFAVLYSLMKPMRRVNETITKISI